MFIVRAYLNFVFEAYFVEIFECNKANFAGVAGRYLEKFNEIAFKNLQNKTKGQNLNMLLFRRRNMLYIQLFWLFWAHPFYVSVTTIDQSRDKTSLEISSRIFFDDLEAALKDEFGGKADLKNAGDNTKNADLIRQYFHRHFQIRIDGNTVGTEFLGFSIEGEAAWCFLEAKGVTSVQKLEVYNSLLYPSFKEQIHIFHLNINGKKKSSKLNNPDVRAKFEF